MTLLYRRSIDRGYEHDPISIPDLARELREDLKDVALVCEKLIQSGFVHGDETMLSYVRLSHLGVEYCEGLAVVY